MKQPLIVELFGPGGSGKSSIAPEISARLEAKGLIVEHRFQKVSWTGLFLKPWGTVSTLVKLMLIYSRLRNDFIIPRDFAGKNGFRAYLLLTRVQNYMRRMSIVWAKAPDIFLIEQGEVFFQIDGALYSKNPSCTLPLRSEAVIVFEISEAEVVSRLHSRGLRKGPESRAIAGDPEFRNQYLASFENATMGARQKVRALTVDGSRPLEESASEICDYLSSILDSRRPGENLSRRRPPT